MMVFDKLFGIESVCLMKFIIDGIWFWFDLNICCFIVLNEWFGFGFINLVLFVKYMVWVEFGIGLYFLFVILFMEGLIDFFI